MPYKPSPTEFATRKVGAQRKRCKATCRNVGNDFPEINRKGRRCKKWALIGKDYCYIHKIYNQNRLGPANPNWRGGKSMSNIYERRKLKYIHVVPEKMREILEVLSKNPELLHSGDEIILLDARIHDLLSQLEHGATSEVIRDSKQILDQVFVAVKDGDGERVSTLLNTLRSTLHSGDEEADEIWKQIHETMEQRRKIVDTERRVMDSEEMSMRADKLLIVAAEIGRVARKYIPEKQHPLFMDEFREIFLPHDSPHAKMIDLK